MDINNNNIVFCLNVLGSEHKLQSVFILELFCCISTSQYRIKSNLYSVLLVSSCGLRRLLLSSKIVQTVTRGRHSRVQTS